MKNNFFKLTLLFIVLAELLSFFGFHIPIFGAVCFAVILFLTLILSLEKLEYGLYILLAELFIGSKGYLFSLDLGGLNISIRLGLFLIVLSVWILKLIREPKEIKELAKNKIFKPYALLILFLGFGVIQALRLGNNFSDIFFDLNGYLYFALIGLFYTVINSQEKIKNILQIFAATIMSTALKTLTILFFFSHQYFELKPLYKWVRDTGIGEITIMGGNFYRVFFQGQIWVLFGLFIFLIFLIFYKKIEEKFFTKKELWILIVCSSLVLILSFSRSFWVGALAGFGVLFFWLKFIIKFEWSRIFKLIGAIFLVLIFELGFIYFFVNVFATKTDFGDIMKDRVSKMEAAGSSRMNLLKPLTEKIGEHPIIGSGFGATVTYKSLDPRLVTEYNPEGIYTTFAFEWGFLDIWSKIGLAGLLAYLWLIWKIFINNYQNSKNNFLKIGLLIGLVILVVVNIFTPYLNHPLGIGYLMLANVIIYKQ